MPDSRDNLHSHSQLCAGLKILFVGALPPGHNAGGMAIVSLQLLSGLAGRGHQVRALAPATEEGFAAASQFASAHPELSIKRFPVKAYPVPYFDASHPLSAESRESEGENIRREFHAAMADARPDVVIVGRGAFLWHVADLARAAGLPFVAVLHDTDLVTGIAGAYPAAVGAQMLERLRQASCVVAVANHLGASMRAWGLADLRVVTNAVDHRKFAPRLKDLALLGQLGIDGRQAIVLHASNLRTVKRSLDIVESAEQVLRHRAHVTYVIAGDGPNRARMEDECRRRGLERQFRFVGWIDHDRMPDLINLADAVVLPSEREGFALVYLETQACGKVLIASDIPAAREAIRDGETGLLFPMGDIAALTDKILLALSDELFRSAIGQRARQSILNRSLDGFITSYERIISDVVHRGR